eukprot:8894636-Pyramimonas_sp.AAC.1
MVRYLIGQVSSVCGAMYLVQCMGCNIGCATYVVYYILWNISCASYVMQTFRCNLSGACFVGLIADGQCSLRGA